MAVPVGIMSRKVTFALVIAAVKWKRPVVTTVTVALKGAGSPVTITDWPATK